MTGRRDVIEDALSRISAELAALPWDWGYTVHAQEASRERVRRITRELEATLNPAESPMLALIAKYPLLGVHVRFPRPPGPTLLGKPRV